MAARSTTDERVTPETLARQAQVLELLLADVAEQIDALIIDSGLSIRGAGRRSGLAQQTMTTMLAAGRDLRLSSIVAVAVALGGRLEVRIRPKEREQISGAD